MAHTEKRLSCELLFHGKIFDVTRDRVELEDGQCAWREIVHHHGGAGVVAVNEKREVFLVRQYRYAFGREMLEIPAGKLEYGEEPRGAALRELEEECGLLADEVIDLHPILPTVGYDTEIIYLYLATGLHETASKLDAGEFLDVVRIPLERAIAMIDKGEIQDGKTVAALLKADRILK